MAGMSTTIPGIGGPAGQNMGAGNQIIGGKQFNIYSPEWYQAQRDYNTAKSGAAGTAAGTFTKNYSDTAFPGLFGSALGGLNSALGAATSGLAGGAGGVGGVGGGVGAGGPVGGGAGVSPLQMADPSKANAAAYGTAKDQVGKSSRAAVTALNDLMGSQGMLGSGAQVQGTKDIVADASGQLGQVSRDQAQENAGLAQRTAELNYQGALTQRGQDIGAQEANARLALEQRQQYMSLLNTILGGLGGALGKGGGAAAAGGDSNGMLY
jgi:hypothetical protein